MVALIGAFGGLHLAQQGVHFFQTQAAVGPHRTVAGHAAEQLVVGAGNHRAGLMLAQLGQHAARQFYRIALRQSGWHGAYRQGFA